MMPKEVLTDRTIRAEVLPGLSLNKICTLLERFQPDDFAADPLPRGQCRSLEIFSLVVLLRACCCFLQAQMLLLL